MADLNLWRMALADPDAQTQADVTAGRAIEFGCHDTGYPFTTQVKIGQTVVETDDQAHPLSDGLVPGVDRARGFPLMFAGVALGTSRPATRAWAPRMDEAGRLASWWEDATVRAVAGRVGSLTNVDRARMVYGRPRAWTLDLDRARGGWVPWSGEWQTMHPGWYGMTESVTVGAYNVALNLTNTGQSPTWGRYEILGPITDPVVTLTVGGATVWSHRFPGGVAAGAVLSVDPRPWVRAIRLAGAQANGIRRGARLADSPLPLGASALKLTSAAGLPGTTAATKLTVRHRPAYAAL